MSDCSNHKKEVGGVSDMKVLAEMIGDLHYGALKDLLKELSAKLKADAYSDLYNKRDKLSDRLLAASDSIAIAFIEMYKAWQISKPFMEESK